MKSSLLVVSGIVAVLGVTRPAGAVGSCGTDCYQADTCDAADVQAAVDAALASNGGTVTIPDPTSGQCSWATTVNVDASAHPISIRGQSQDTTAIVVSTKAFAFDGAQGVAWSLSDLSITDAACSGDCDAIVSIGGTADGWRIHHINLATTGVFSRYFRTYSSTPGLIDHVTATASTASEFLTADADNWPEWKKPVDLGSGNAVFVEDCDIAYSDHWEGRPFDGENGGRMVVRHNKLQNEMLGSHGFDSGFGASVFSVVAYDNDFTFDASDGWSRFTHFRGGTGLLYDNTFTASAQTWVTAPIINLAIYRNPADSGGNESWQPCNGTQYRMCDNIDKNWSLTSGNGPYNCTTDQDCVNRGAGTSCKWKFCSMSHLDLCTADADCPSGETCSAFLDGPASDGYPCFMQPGFATQMQSYPWYEWGNTWSGGQGSSACGSPPCNVDFGVNVSELQKNRDYFDDVPSGASLPSTCTPLEAFFDTADQTLYRCDATNTWSAYYKEFPYPHPLQNGGGGSGNTGGTGGSAGGGPSGGAAGNGSGASSGSGANGGSGASSGSGGSKNAAAPGSDSGCGCRSARLASPRRSLAFAMLALSLLLGAGRRRAFSRKR